MCTLLAAAASMLRQEKHRACDGRLHRSTCPTFHIASMLTRACRPQALTTHGCMVM